MNVAGLVLILITSLFIPGIISIVKAKFSGRKSQHIFQPIFDVIRLFRKGSVYSTTSSIIFQIAPVIYFSTVVAASFFIPLAEHSGVFSFKNDFIYFAYLLALGKFMLIIGAMDTGSGFEGMGANREALYSMLIEPAFFILMASLALLTGYTSFHEIFAMFFIKGSLSYLIAGLAIYVIFQIAMIENSRLLIDDPRTHLELTMVHEVIVLDNSGFDMALINIATWLKFSIYSGLTANLLLPPEYPFVVEILMCLFVAFVFAFFVGFAESFRARNKMATNPAWIIAFSPIALVIFLAVIFIINH